MNTDTHAMTQNTAVHSMPSLFPENFLGVPRKVCTVFGIGNLPRSAKQLNRAHREVGPLGGCGLSHTSDDTEVPAQTSQCPTPLT